MPKLTQAMVEEWVRGTTGDFDYNRILDGRVDPAARGSLRNIMRRLCEKGVAKPVKRRGDGWFRYVETILEPMKLAMANPNKVLDISLPFSLEKYIRIYRKNVIIIFGSKSAGKTAFLINLALMNMGKYPINYLNSDMGEEEFRMRLDKGGVDIEEWDRLVELYPCSLYFEDAIKPDYINIVDFLEVFDEFWRIGEPIQQMASRINNGILVVAIQKNPDVDLGLGGNRAIEKAKFVLSLDPGRIKIIEAKNWADGIITSPRGKVWTYKLVGGIKIINPQEG